MLVHAPFTPGESGYRSQIGTTLEHLRSVVISELRWAVAELEGFAGLGKVNWRKLKVDTEWPGNAPDQNPEGETGHLISFHGSDGLSNPQDWYQESVEKHRWNVVRYDVSCVHSRNRKIATLICVPAAELIVEEPLSIEKDMGTSYLALGAGRGLWTTFDHTLV